MSHELEAIRIREEYRRRDAAGLSSRYTLDNPVFVFHMQEREQAILDALHRAGFALSGKLVLEVGCGSGHILQRFLELGAARGTGIDLMAERIAVGQEQYPALQLSVGDAAHLPYADNSFELVSQFMCLSSVLDADVRREIAAEMWRVLRPGGVLLCYDLRSPDFLYRILFRTYAACRSIMFRPRPSAEIAPTPIHLFDHHELRQLFPSAPLRLRIVSLNFHLVGRAVQTPGLLKLLVKLPFLRTHYLAIARKPLEGRL